MNRKRLTYCVAPWADRKGCDFSVRVRAKGSSYSTEMSAHKTREAAERALAKHAPRAA